MNLACPACGEGIKPHWKTCPACLHPLDVERSVRFDLLLSGIAMISLAFIGLIGIVMNLFKDGNLLTNDQFLFGLGAIIFASMVGGGLIGGSRTERRASQFPEPGTPATMLEYPLVEEMPRGNAVAKGVLMGLLGSVGTILVVFGVIALLIICICILLFVTCLQMLHKYSP